MGEQAFLFCGNGFYTMLDLHHANRGDELSSGFTKKLEEPYTPGANKDRLSMKQITSNPPFMHTRPQYTFDEFFTFLIITEKMECDYIYAIGQKKSSNKSKQI